MSQLLNGTNTPLKIAVLTVSDTRDEVTDSSGKLLIDKLIQANHELANRQIVKDDIYKIRAVISTWISSEEIQVVVITGGTGFSHRDTTPEAVQPLLDKAVDGFGELFRQLSFDQIGTSTLQSRAFAGLANDTLIFCLPGSPNACCLAWDSIIAEQLNSLHGPCNFAGHLKQPKSLVPGSQLLAVSD